MTYDVSDDELADARELEEATGELRHIAGGPGGWAAGTVMDEYDRLRAELAEAQATIARLTEQLRLTTIDQFNAEGANSDIVEAATALVDNGVTTREKVSEQGAALALKAQADFVVVSRAERDQLKARVEVLTAALTGLLRECNENEEHMDEDEPQFSARDIRRRLTSAALAAGTTESEA